MENRSPRWLRISILVLIYGGLLWGGQWGSGWLIDLFGVDFGAAVQSHEFHLMVAGVVFFAVLMAIPFVPGIEISLALLAVFGPKVAVAIYAATLAALAFSYLIGGMLPLGLIASLFGRLGLQRAKALVQTLQPLNAGQRFETLIDHAPKRIVPLLLKHRYIAVIVALNVPGNALIGGGGGIALLAGLSGLFIFSRFLASVALAALPVPLFVMLSSG
ncbi:MAG: hypothetical protein H8E39_01070 [Alphaproteobacteria bacterium]|nr:hypothetical protein [Alphaproteobacteria bacterium]